MATLKDLGYRGLLDNFFEGLSIAERGSFADAIGTRIASDQEIETYKWLGAAPKMRKWIASRQIKTPNVYNYQLKNQKFEVSEEFEIDDIRRDKTGQIMRRVQEMGMAGPQNWDDLITEAILNGHSSPCYDGQPFFSSSHASGDSGTQDNDLVSGDVADLNVATATAPTGAEIAAIIPKLIQKFYTYKDDIGEPLNQNAKAFTIMVPVSFWSSFAQALSSIMLASSTGSFNNSLIDIQKYSGISINLVQNAKLTWTDKFAMFRMDSPMRSIIMQEEVPLQLQYLGPESENAVKADKVFFGAKALRTVGYGYWQRAVRCTLS